MARIGRNKDGAIVGVQTRAGRIDLGRRIDWELMDQSNSKGTNHGLLGLGRTTNYPTRKKK
jgi:hypothetical protein